MKKEWHECPGCGKWEKLQSNRRHWCKCHPAGFIMVSDSVRKLSRMATAGISVLAAATRARGRTVG